MKLAIANIYRLMQTIITIIMITSPAPPTETIKGHAPIAAGQSKFLYLVTCGNYCGNMRRV